LAIHLHCGDNADVDNNVNIAPSTSDTNTRANAIKAIQKQMISDTACSPIFRCPNDVTSP
jgi:ABC-type transport system substrate-binding protein